MATFKKIILILMMLQTIYSCSTTAPAVQTIYSPPEIITEIRERVKDSLIYIPADTATFKALVRCDSLNQAYIQKLEEKPGIRSRIIYKQILDTIYFRAEIDSAAIYIKWKERDTITTKTVNAHTIIQPEQNEQKGLSAIWHYIIYIGAFIALVEIVRIIRRRD